MEPVSQEIEAGAEPSAEDDFAPTRTGTKPATEEMRASLAAIRAAREAAQDRMRRDTRQVRLVSVMFIAAVAAGALAVAGHFRGMRARATAGRSAPGALSTPAPGSVSPAGAEGTASGSLPVAGAAAVEGARAPGVPIPLSPVAEPRGGASGDAEAGAEPPADLGETLTACNQAYDGRRWPAATEACGRAADLRPRDAALAMKVAQAFHARGRYADAGTWARRALALNDVDPEALVIVAHAERRAGHPAAAKNAYRRYLVLAPRGWHAAEARAAVRPPTDRARARTRSGSASLRPLGAPVASSIDSNADQR